MEHQHIRKDDRKTKICEICNDKYQGRTGQKYCSNECRQYKSRISYMESLNEESLYKIRFEVFKRDDFTCQYCGRNVIEDKVKIQLEHIIPISKGGKTVLSNLTTACKECNCGKGSTLLIQKI